MEIEDIPPAEFERFNNFIHSMIDNREDDLAFVLRAQILIEHELIIFIQKRLKRPGALKRVTHSYSNKISVAVSLGLTPTIEQPLRYIGSLRNRFAHRLDQKLTEKEANEFRASLGPQYSKFAEELLKLLDMEYIKPLEKGKQGLLDVLGPKEQIAQCFLALWHLIRMCDAYQASAND